MLHPSIQPVPMKKTLRGNELDMRVSDLIGEKLKELILESVKRTQSGGILKPLPDVLRISHKQFISIEDDTEEMQNSKHRFFYTPLNVMEVEVDETFDKVDTDQIIEAKEQGESSGIITEI